MNSIFLCKKQDYQYLKEYIDSLAPTNLFLYDDASSPFTEEKEFFCIRRIPWALLPSDAKISFLNTEQLSVPSKLEEYKTYAKEGVELYDYTEGNNKYSGKNPTILPYVERPEETIKLKEFMKQKKEYDVAVCGSISEHRSKIVDLLIKNDISVDYITCAYGDERDARIGRCSVLLNLHFNKTFSVYETIRCDRWRFAGMPIVTEPCCGEVPEGVVSTYKLIDEIKKLTKGKEIPLPTIGLCMIMKDESHILHEVLESTYKLIDTYCVVDTGSSDNSMEIVKTFFDSKNIQGEVISSPWKGFGESRSEALKLCDDKMDYILMIDADDLMGYPVDAKQFLKKVLGQYRPNSCQIDIRRGTMSYKRTQIFKARDSWRYVGVLHEYPTNDKKGNRMITLPPEIYMVGRTLGARSKIDGNKYLRDAETIEKALETEPNNERYVFYLAQSYRDAGNKEKAVEWYKKRIEMGKWYEEVYVSAYNIAKLTLDKEWVWKAHELNPKRAEAFWPYLAFHRMNAKWSRELYSMALYASSIPMPTDQALFIETEIYNWRLLDELAIISYYVGEKEVCKKTCMKLLSENKMPAEHRERIENNLKLALS